MEWHSVDMKYSLGNISLAYIPASVLMVPPAHFDHLVIGLGIKNFCGSLIPHLQVQVVGLNQRFSN